MPVEPQDFHQWSRQSGSREKLWPAPVHLNTRPASRWGNSPTAEISANFDERRTAARRFSDATDLPPPVPNEQSDRITGAMIDWPANGPVPSESAAVIPYFRLTRVRTQGRRPGCRSTAENWLPTLITCAGADSCADEWTCTRPIPGFSLTSRRPSVRPPR